MKLDKYKRIIIIGCPGSGKSTLSLILSTKLNLPVIHLDKLLWKPNWVQSSPREFDSKLLAELHKDKWIMDGIYRRTLDLRIKYANLVIFLDFDTEICINSYIERVNNNLGIVRLDMTEGCIETYDEEFVIYIRDFNKTQRTDIYKTLNKSSIEKIIFKNRNEVGKFIDQI